MAPAVGGEVAGVICQRCLQHGHWTYQCKNAAVYKARPSRTKQLFQPKSKSFLDPSELLPEPARGSSSFLQRLPEKPAASAATDKKKKKKRKHGDGSSSSSSSSSSSNSDSDSSSSSSGSSSSGSSSSDSDGDSSSSSSDSDSNSSSSSSSSSSSDSSSSSSSSSDSSSSEDAADAKARRNVKLNGAQLSAGNIEAAVKSLSPPTPRRMQERDARRGRRSDPIPINTSPSHGKDAYGRSHEQQVGAPHNEGRRSNLGGNRKRSRSFSRDHDSKLPIKNRAQQCGRSEASHHQLDADEALATVASVRNGGDVSGDSGSEDLRARLQRRRRARYGGMGDQADSAASPSTASAIDKPRGQLRDEYARLRGDGRSFNQGRRGGGGGMRSDGVWRDERHRGSRDDDRRVRRTLSPVPIDAIPEADADDRWGYAS